MSPAGNIVYPSYLDLAVLNKQLCHLVSEEGRWKDLDRLLLRNGPLAGPDFEPGEDVKTVVHEMLHVLVIGAGGLGCELLKDLGMYSVPACCASRRLVWGGA